MKYTLFMIWLVIYFDVTLCYSNYMLSNNYCSSKTLSSSSNIMGHAPAASTSRTVLVKRGNTLLTSTDNYIPGETLNVYISSTAGIQYVFETSAGTFSGNSVGCSYRKTIENGATITMPTSGTVTIKVGWASGQSVVYYNSMTITPAATTPTKAPTLAPTFTKDAPTPIPTKAPTFSPTLTPTPTSYTLVTFQISESIAGVSSSALSTQSTVDGVKVALVNAISIALISGGFEPYQLYITSIETGNSIFRKITLQSNSIKYSYMCSYILEKTSFSSAATLASGLKVVVTSGTFSTLVIANLHSSGISSLSSVSSLSSLGYEYSTELIVIGDGGDISRNKTSYTNLKVIVAVPIAIGIAAIAFFLKYHFQHKDETSVLEKEHRNIKILYAISTALSIASLILVAKWARKNDYSSSNGDTNYLGSLDWKNDIFPWHPVLMVGGFFVAQILAPAMWVIFPESYRVYAKVLHVILQSGGVITVALGLYAATEAKKATKSPHLVSLHSWIGIAAISLFATNYIFGLAMAIIGRYVGKALELTHNHKILGFSSLGLSVFAIVTGISTKILRGSCDHSNASCSISNSIGIIVIIASIFTILVGSIRYQKTSSSPSNVIIPEKGSSANYKNIPSNYTDASHEIESNNKFHDSIIRKNEEEESNEEGNYKERNNWEENDQSYFSYFNPVSWFSN